MKKLVLFAVAAVAITLASCAGKGITETTSANDTIPATIVEEVEAVIPDSVNGDTTIVDEVAVETSAE